MSIGLYIKNYINSKNVSCEELAKRMNVEHEKLIKKLNEDNLSAKDLIGIGSILHMDLEQMRLELTYKDIECETFVYVPIEKLDIEEIRNRKLIDVKKFKVHKQERFDDDGIKIPVFEPIIDNEGNETFELRMRQANTIKKVKAYVYNNNNKPISYSRIKKENSTFVLEKKYYLPNRKNNFKNIKRRKVNNKVNI